MLQLLRLLCLGEEWDVCFLLRKQDRVKSRSDIYTWVSHLQGGVECLQIVFGAQSSLKAVQDEDDSDVSAGLMGATQLLGDRLDLWRDVLIWAH